MRKETDMNIQRILRAKGRDVETIRPEAKVGEAAMTMRRKGIGALVVSRDGRTIEGIISERDIVHALPDHGAHLAELFVSALMTRDVVRCDPGDSVSDLMMLMTERRVRHIPVVERGQLAGIVSIGDVVKSRIEEVESDAHAMRELIAHA